MKAKYFCDVCGKDFPTPEEASSCEKSHEIENKRESLRKKSIDALNEMMNAHIITFHEIPEYTPSEEAAKVANKCIAKWLDSTLDDIIDHLGDESEE